MKGVLALVYSLIAPQGVEQYIAYAARQCIFTVSSIDRPEAILKNSSVRYIHCKFYSLMIFYDCQLIL